MPAPSDGRALHARHEQATLKLEGAPMRRPAGWPSLFVTDITTNPSAKDGDWQQGGTPITPNDVFGSWRPSRRRSRPQGGLADRGLRSRQEQTGTWAQAPIPRPAASPP